MKILMIPRIRDFRKGYESGVKRVIEAYHKYFPLFGIEAVHYNASDYDVKAVHAGATGGDCDVAHLHGMYFTADYDATKWEYKANANIAEAVRTAKIITVPSAWVSEVFERDMRVRPRVLPHGIEADEWKHSYEHEQYVLWNKNRSADVCDPMPMYELAKRANDVKFLTTFSPKDDLPNIKAIGLQQKDAMKVMIQKAGIYLSTTKETFGIGTLEAMASGVPILGFDHGGNIDLVQHGVNGYLARTDDIDDLLKGLDYCMRNRDTLGKNSAELARNWKWEDAMAILYNIYKEAAVVVPPTVSVIIPLYNKSDTVEKAITSALSQSIKPSEIIIVNDGSTDNPAKILSQFGDTPETRFIVINQENAGVAHSRNNGIERSTSKYVCCLDSDDAIDTDFLKTCVDALEDDRSISIAYTGMSHVYADGSTKLAKGWPGEFDYDRQIQKYNQIPTCCVFKRDMWERIGGYKQRYAPMGAGSEDAEFWLRAGAYGFRGKKVTNAGFFLYSLNTGITTRPDYKEVDWTTWHPWVDDGQHPLASLATPRRLSHQVRQYDKPKVSIIIPVGKGHEECLYDALDSLEAQLFRRWEAIVVWDSPSPIPAKLSNAYPYIKLFHTEKPGSGSGVARNLGVTKSRAELIMFLDADDWLFPDAINRMVFEWNEYESIIYSDYVGKVFTTREDAKDINLKLLDYNDRTGEAVFRHNASEYNCEMAQAQPDKKVYHWCIVTCLIPKSWHNDIGGFDESMSTWEDVDYFWRLARAGKCFRLIKEPLIVYRFNTGSRREEASGDKKKALSLLKYMSDKYKGIKNMPCDTCGSRGSSRLVQRQPATTKQIVQQNTSIKVSGRVDSMSNEDFLLARYLSLNIGNHPVMGPSTKIKYGYRSGGEIFLVHKLDIQTNPHLFEVVDGTPEIEVKNVVVPDKEVEPPSSIKDEEQEVHDNQVLDRWKSSQAGDVIEPPKPVDYEEPTEMERIMLLPGVSKKIAILLADIGLDTVDKIAKSSVKELQSVYGIGKKRAEMILEMAKDVMKTY